MSDKEDSVLGTSSFTCIGKKGGREEGERERKREREREREREMTRALL